jgi:hypothetical protein
MKEIILPIVEKLQKRLSEKLPLIQVIQGPRQVGKTTSLIQLIDLMKKKDSFHFVSGDSVVARFWVQEQWQLAQQAGKILIIDEIQKIPYWSETIKTLWDESKRKKHIVKCILTGSSSMQLQKGLTETLTGRFEILEAFHWNYSFSNQLKKMSLDEYLTYGGYPGSYVFIKDKKRWTDYLTQSIIDTVIGKDILTQATIKNPALFKQAFYILSSFPAQVISYNKLLGQLQDRGNIDLVKYYIELYESAFLIKSIFKFSKNELKKKSSSPKIIVMAPALSSFHRLTSLTAEDQGRLFESHVGAELVRQGFEVYYWTEGDFEVDYIIKYKNKIFAIEVKSDRKRRTSSVEILKKKYPEVVILFITKDNFNKFANDINSFLLEAL